MCGFPRHVELTRNQSMDGNALFAWKVHTLGPRPFITLFEYSSPVTLASLSFELEFLETY